MQSASLSLIKDSQCQLLLSQGVQLHISQGLHPLLQPDVRGVLGCLTSRISALSRSHPVTSVVKLVTLSLCVKEETRHLIVHILWKLMLQNRNMNCSDCRPVCAPLHRPACLAPLHRPACLAPLHRPACLAPLHCPACLTPLHRPACHALPQHPVCLA